MLRSRERAVRREQWTEIDRALAEKGRSEMASSRMTSSNRAARELGFEPNRRSIACSFFQDSDLPSGSTNEAGSFRRTTSAKLRERQVSKDVIKSRAHSRQRTIDSGMDRVRERGRERNG